MRQNLSRVALPRHYDLEIAVQEDAFTGHVRITIQPTEPITSFRINSRGLELGKMTVGGQEVKYTERTEDETVMITLPEKMDKAFVLEIDYRGEFKGSSMESFYKSSYRGTPLYSTHFEPTDARRAFPCFDQPDMKATFSVTLKAPEGFVALSNNALVSEKNGVFVFEKTPPMSTYIVAFVVGKLSYIETVMVRHPRKPSAGELADKKTKLEEVGIPIRVYAQEEEKEWGRFSLEVATRCLKYFEIDYPLDKLDMVAVPSFAMGAMENWGLITYRSTSLLYDASTTSTRSKENIAITVCHELAHMWFGNLVTMEWWSDLWLNEGFATWAATLAIAGSLKDIMPWDAWTSFINDDVEAGMTMESIKSTHKIGIEVMKPVEIDQIFDAISYSKGSSIIKMLENWLGAEEFRKGLVHYLNEKKYQNAVTEDLWTALTNSYNKGKAKASMVNVSAVIDPWIKRKGFPIIDVKDAGKTLQLTQRRFTVGFEEDAEPWPVLIKIMWDGGKTSDFIMEGRKFTVEKASDYYKLNNEVSGFYRVQYEDLDGLLGPGAPALSTANRMNVYSDAFAIAMALKGPLPLEYLGALKDEDNYDVLGSTLGGLQSLVSMFYDVDAKRDFFRGLILDIIGDKAEKIEFNKSSADINEVSRNTLVISKAVYNGHQPTIDRFRKMKLGDDMISEYIRPFYSAIVDERFNDIFETYKGTATVGLRQHALIALGTTADKKNLETLFSNFKDIEPHDSVYLYASLGANLKFRNEVADFFNANYEGIKAHISNSGLLRHALEFTLKNVVETGPMEKVLKFLETIDGDKAMRSAIDKCRDSLALKTRFREHYKNIVFSSAAPAA